MMLFKNIGLTDLIAGTISDFNLETNEHSHNKFTKVSEELLTNEEKIKIFKINFNKTGSTCQRIKIYKAHS